MGDEIESALAYIGPTALLLSAMALVVTVINWVLRKRRRRILLGVELVIFISTLLAYSRSAHWAALSGWAAGEQDALTKILWTTWCAAVAFVLDAVVDKYLLAARKLHDGTPAMPKLLRDLASLAIYVVAGMLVVHFVFAQPITALAATSGAFVFILGYSAQATLGEVFAGLSLNLAQAFRKGDYVKIGDAMGLVVDHNWRALTVRTKEGNLAVVPNSVASKVTILNFSLPQPESRGTVEVVIDYSVPPARASQILLDAIRESPFVLEKPRPRAVPHSYLELGIKYKCKFWCKHGGDIGDAEIDVLSTIWHALERNNVAFSYNRFQTSPSHPPPPPAPPSAADDDADDADDDGFSLARRVPTFSHLKDDEIRALTARARTRTFGPPERVIRQGDDGHSMFLIADGTVEVSIAQQDGTSLVVASLGAGESFGVMSLLTGEKRSATVRATTVCKVFELDKGALQSVFDRNPEAIDAIAEHVGQMQLTNERKNSEYRASKDADGARKASLVSNVVGRIRAFFAESAPAQQSEAGKGDVRF